MKKKVFFRALPELPTPYTYIYIYMDKSPNYQMSERDNTPGRKPEMWNHFIFSIALSLECSLAVQPNQQMLQKAVWFFENVPQI